MNKDTDFTGCFIVGGFTIVMLIVLGAVVVQAAAWLRVAFGDFC